MAFEVSPPKYLAGSWTRKKQETEKTYYKKIKLRTLSSLHKHNRAAEDFYLPGSSEIVELR